MTVMQPRYRPPPTRPRTPCDAHWLGDRSSARRRSLVALLLARAGARPSSCSELGSRPGVVRPQRGAPAPPSPAREWRSDRHGASGRRREDADAAHDDGAQVLTDEVLAGRRPPLSTPSTGVATKIDEYAPVSMPMNRARANSRSVTCPSIQAPTTSSDETGSRADSDVFSERISTWFVDTLTRSAAPEPGGGDAPLVLLDPVEHDDRVVQRVAEDRQEGDHGRRRHLEAEHRVDPGGDDDVVEHGDDCRHGHPPLEPDGDDDREQHEEDERGR